MQKTALEMTGLQGCVNFRDLGGYPCGTGNFIKKNKIFRSDSLSGMAPGDVAILKTLNIKCIIDLSREGEAGKTPGPLKDSTAFILYNIPLTDGIHGRLDRKVPGDGACLSELYKAIVDEAPGLLISVLRLMIWHKNHNILFHCPNGRDLTGVVTALLYLVAGVDEADIVKEYALSQKPAAGNSDGLNRFEAVQSAPYANPQDMNAFLNHIRLVYRNAELYFIRNGFAKSEMDVFRAMIMV